MATELAGPIADPMTQPPSEAIGDGEGLSTAFDTDIVADGDLKRVPDNDLKNIDVHDFKEEFVGKDNVSKFDIYKDQDGKLVLVKKSDTSVKVETDLTLKEAEEEYPKSNFDVEEPVPPGSTS